MGIETRFRPLAFATLLALASVGAASRPALAQLAEPPAVPTDLPMQAITHLSVERSALLNRHDALQLRIDMQRQNCSATFNADRGPAGACAPMGGELAHEIRDYRAAVEAYRNELDATVRAARKPPSATSPAPAPSASPAPP
ncbi:MAG TPA: hypothetical protein VMF53_15390 [Alphaproteobacteria bacterium]|nr:hypothetical protein [Alphaproteobacteria bacterium]